MQKVLQILLLSHCLFGLSKSEDNDEANQPGREKRHISMLRLGRSIHLPPLVPPYILDEDEDREDRQVGTFGNLPRLGTKDLDSYRSERAPPLPRMGQYEKFLAEYRRYLDDDEDQDVRQIYLSIPRTGRFARDTDSVEKLKEDNERAVPLPRYGYRDVGEEDDSERALPLPRYGYRDVGEVSERYLPRYGQREIEETRALPRYGLRESENIDEDYRLDEGERAVPLPRIGYRDVDKRKMSMLRMGRSEAENKRAMSMLRLGKRKMSMLRMGRSQDTTEEESKRAMSMLRLGKRAMSMLRLGRSGTTTEEEKRGRMSMLRMGKRKMSMLRMGKRDSENNQEKRGRMSMLRMGRSSGTDEEQEVEKRPMSMLRMGKRKMSMLRMGKRDIGEDPAAEVEKRAVSMLRMGKKDDTSNAAN